MSLHAIKKSIKKLYTIDNTVLFVAVLIALGWLWGTMDTLQNNFRLQTEVNKLGQQVAQNKIEAQNLELENQYYSSQEYQELQARQRLNKAAHGEHLLVLAANTASDKNYNQPKEETAQEVSNFQAWISFFFANH